MSTPAAVSPSLSAAASGPARAARGAAAALAAPLLALLAGCGERAPQADPGDPWPLRVPVPGVLGYASLELPAADLAALVADLVGAAPLALGDGRVVALAFDPLALGGAAGVVLPVTDAETFLASLEIMPQVEPLGSGRYRLALPPDAGLAVAIAAWHGFTAEAGALGMLGAVGSLGPRSVTLYVAAEGERAFVVPSFEGVASAREACAALGGLEEPGRAVLTLDVERVVTAYRDALESTRHRALGALGTAEGVLSRHDGGAEATDPGRALRATARRLLEGLPLGGDDILGVQWRTELDPRALQGLQDERLLDAVSMLEFRCAWSPRSSLGSLLEALRPVPAQSAFLLVLRFDPQARDPLDDQAGVQRLSRDAGVPEEAARAAWAAVESAFGALDGLVAADAGSSSESFALHFALRPGATIDWDALVGALLAALPPDATAGLVLEPDGAGAHVLRDGQGGALLTAGVTAGVAWIAAGQPAEPPLQACRALSALAGELPDEGPVLRFGATAFRAELSVEGREAVLRWDAGSESIGGR